MSSTGNPLEELLGIQKEMNRLFQEFSQRAFFDKQGRLPEQPRVDIFQKNGEWVLVAEIPGVGPDQVQVHLEENRLSLEGNMGPKSTQSQRAYHLAERYRGTFHRSFELPADIDVPRVQARFRDGLLRVTLPRKSGSQGRRIQVEAD